MNAMQKGFFVTLLAGLLLFPFTGCQREEPGSLAGTFTGRLDGTDAFIAVAYAGEEIVAYVCDGYSMAQWLRGTVTGETITLTANDADIRATITDDAVTGRFTPAAGPPRTFTARAAEGTGFYRASQTIAGLTYVGGWILLSDGQQRGAVKQGSTVLADDRIMLDPENPVVVLPNGVSLTARPVEALRTETTSTSHRDVG